MPQNNYFVDAPYVAFQSVQTEKRKVSDVFDFMDSITGQTTVIPDFYRNPTNGKMTVAKPKMIMEETKPEVITQQEEPVKKSRKISSTQALQNGKVVIDTLMTRLNLTKDQAAGVAGVMMAESGLNPAAYNKQEKAGKLKASRANGAGYGGGILQWSMDRKRTTLASIGKEGYNIEDLSLEDQLEMLIKEFEGPYKNTLEGIKNSTTASQAAATFYCHNVAGFSSSKAPATQDEIDKVNKRYAKFGNSAVVNTGMDFAEQLKNV